MFPLQLSQILVRRRGKAVLGPTDLVLAPEGTTIILGPNGSGKTTLLRVMHGIERITSGTMTWAPDDPSRQAFVFQSPIVLRRSVAENLAYPLRLVGAHPQDIAQAVDHWLQRIGLAALRNSPAQRLSGGERQKLAIARALVRKPAILFLDEPCANLDGHATRAIEALLQEARQAGTRVIMSTHDIGQARRLADDLVFMLGGKVHETGDAERMFQNPGTPELGSFLRGDIVT